MSQTFEALGHVPTAVISTGGIFAFIVILLCIFFIAWYVSTDARKRGLSELRVLLLTLGSIVFFPVALIVYLVARPPMKSS